MRVPVGARVRDDPELTKLLAELPLQPLQTAQVRTCAYTLSRWLLGGPGKARGRSARASRLEHLVDALDRDEGRGTLREFLRQSRRPDSMIRLLAETGIPVEASLPREISRRLFTRILAVDVDSTDYAALFALAHLKHGDDNLLEAISERAWASFAPLFEPQDDEVRTAFELVLRRVVGAGLARDLLQMGTHERDRYSPFFALESSALAFLGAALQPGHRVEFDASLACCRADLAAILARTEVRGVSTNLIFRLEQAQALLDRLEQLGQLLAHDHKGREFFGVLLRSAILERSFFALVRSKLKQLSRKVVEHAGQAGEHYVVRNLREYVAMGISAVGGGAVTAFTAMGKFALSATGLAPGLLGLAHSLNYSASFTFMQFCGLTLASRQPSVTAAALADNLKLDDGLEREVELVAGITRAQTISAMGNVLVALPTAMLVDRLVVFARGTPWLSAEESHHVIESLLPQHPTNVLFAAFTGVLLWLATLVGGWAANWSVLHSLPLALAENAALRRSFGVSGAARVGRLAQRYFGGILGYIALGFMMGFVPVLAPFMGLPITTPHVTLSSAALGWSISADVWAGTFDASRAAWAFLGVLLIGFLNFAVSFALAFRLALRAMDLHKQGRKDLRRGLLRAMAKDPLRFLLPPRTQRSPEAGTSP